MNEEERKVYNQKHSPKTLLRMGWDYYNTESSARRVAEFTDALLIDLLDYVKGNGERPPTLFGVQEKLEFLLK